MTTPYYDTSALLKLYVEEDFSSRITGYVLSQNTSISIHAFHEVEMENALRLKAMRKDITREQLRQILRRIAEDTRSNRLSRNPVHWPDAFREAARLSAAVTERCGCRTLDILHIALAKQWASSIFVSLDDRQIQAARLTGLAIWDPRTAIHE